MFEIKDADIHKFYILCHVLFYLSVRQLKNFNLCLMKTGVIYRDLRFPLR
jgi:hypothetical protein